MQTLLQLNPPIPMKTPRGDGMAVMVIDYGPDFDLWWTVVLSKGDHAGEIWTYANPEVRGVENITMNRRVPSLPSNGKVQVVNGHGAGLNPEAVIDAHPGEKEPYDRINGRQLPPPMRG